MKKLFLFLFILFAVTVFAENDHKLHVTYHSKQSEKDRRFEYDYELLKLALEKTKEKYGDYELNYLEYRANYKRIQLVAQDNSYPNLIFKQSVTKDKLEKFAYANFPVDKGVVGYRVAFLSKKKANILEDVKDIDELKKYSIIQGIGWLDGEILETHGFQVHESPNYEGMFKMVALNRSDLFFRGINEIFAEWQEYKGINDLAYDKSILLYYPLPRFFFTNKANQEVIDRVQEGLLIANADGSIDKLWMEYYGESLRFVELEGRRVFNIANPLIEGIDEEFKKYIYTFEDLKNMLKD